MDLLEPVELMEAYSEYRSFFFHQGRRYSLNKLLAATAKLKTERVPMSRLAWNLAGDADPERVAAADPSVPILVFRQGTREVIVDGLHRTKKALALGDSSMGARRISQSMLNAAAL
jgi:hypothetical protein